MVGDLQAGDADDLAGCVAQHIYTALVQVLEFDVGEIVGHFLAAVQSKWGKTVSWGHRAYFKRHLYLVGIKVKGWADLI